MIKKRFMTLILAAALMLSACAKGENPADTEETTKENQTQQADTETSDDSTPTPAVWQVTDPESGNSIKMMGTIHMVPESSDFVPQYVMDIYNESDAIAVEYDVSKVTNDMVIQLQYLSYFVPKDGSVITDHLTPENYEGAKAYLTEKGFYNEMFDSYNAQYWENLLTSAAIMSIEGMSDSGIDTYFIDLAKSDGKEVRDIEELADQMNAITATSDDMCNFSISEFLKLDEEEFEEEFKALYNVWATGDVEAYIAMDKESVESYPEELQDDYAVYDNLMITQRNIGMAEEAAKYIENGDNIFYMVGFAHFCGDGSVIDLLEEQGYTVERIH